MALHHNRSLTLDRQRTERQRGATLRPVGERLANLFRGSKDHDPRFREPEEAEWLAGEQWPTGDEVLPRFPLTQHGYDCAAVDAHVAELERELSEVDRELAELRAQSAPRDEVAGEIKRIGEQTSAVLIAANEQRAEILRGARDEADRWIAEATAQATTLTAESEVRLRELQSQHEAVERERDRLLEEVRAVSVALAALADSRNQPIPAQAVEGTASDRPQSHDF